MSGDNLLVGVMLKRLLIVWIILCLSVVSIRAYTDQAQTNYDHFNDFGNGYGQSFVAGTQAFLTGINIVIQDNAHPGSFEMYLWKTDADGFTNGDPVAVGHLLKTEITSPEPHWYFVRFDAPYQQTLGEYLAFTINSLTSGTNGYNEFGYNTSNAYTNGMIITDRALSSYDWAFKTIVDPLYVDFSTDKQTGLTPLDVAFSSSVVGTNLNNLRYSWDFNNDGVPDATGLSSGPITNTYTNAGVYSVSLTVSNEFGEVSSCVKQDLITAIHPELHADFTADKKSGLLPLNPVFVSSIWGVADTNAFCSWDFDNNGTYEQRGWGLNLVANSYATAGVYSVSLTVSNAGGLVAITKTNMISVAAPASKYVSLVGSNVPPYSSIATAARTIQSALDSSVNGSSILVLQGVYSGLGNRMIDFKGKRVSLRTLGGYESTIIDCESNGPAFYFHSGELTNSFISGFTIKNCGQTNGDAGWTYSLIKSASGIVCLSNSNPRISSCLITDNRAFSGGGIYVKSASPKIENCIITANYARYGAGIYCAKGNVVISNCTISAGKPDSVMNALPVRIQEIHGGGIYCVSNSVLAVKGGEISDNLGGGIFCSNSTATISNVLISGNSTGGSMMNHYSPSLFYGARSGIGGGAVFVTSTATLDNCTIRGNSATNGGGILCQSHAKVTVRGCIIASNAAFSEKVILTIDDPPIVLSNQTINGTGGGAMADFSTLILANSTFFGNYSADGGGVAYIKRATGSVIACLFSNNLAAGNLGSTTVNIDDTVKILNTITNATGRGGAIFCSGSRPAVSNCIMTANRAGSGGGLASVNGSYVKVTGCTFSNNSALNTDAGGGAVLVCSAYCSVSNCAAINNRAGEYTYESKYIYSTGEFEEARDFNGFGGAFFVTSNGAVRATDCRLLNNFGARGGSGFYCDNWSTGTFERCMISGGFNSETQYTGCGGGGLVIDSVVDMKVCVVTDNQAASGGGLYASNSTLRFLNSTIGYNRVNTGGGIYMGGGSAAFTNSIVWNNGTPALFTAGRPSLSATKSYIQGGVNRRPEPADPRLRFGYRLAANSPCIDNAIGPYTTQLDVNRRTPWNDPSVTNPSPATIRDIGAYEFADIDKDRMDDAWELMTFGNLTQGTNSDADADGLLDYIEYDFNTDSARIDTDGDALTDMQEWIAGTSGSDDNSIFTVDVATNALEQAGSFVITWSSVTGRSYTVLSKSNLFDSSWITKLSGIIGDGTSKCYTNIDDGPCSFFRIKVTRP